MLGTNHGYYKKQDRIIKLRLKVHQVLTDYHMEHFGHSKKKASKYAYGIITGEGVKALENLLEEYSN